LQCSVCTLSYSFWPCLKEAIKEERKRINIGKKIARELAIEKYKKYQLNGKCGEGN
jgi:hypothetical protein